jgi:hypothetical protein
LFGAQPAGGAGSTATETGDVLWIYVECAKCGERLRIRVNKANDLSLASDISDEDGDGDGGGGEDDAAPSSGYILKKEILGNNCPRLMYVRATFDSRRRLLEMTAEGCRLLTRAEYEAGTGEQPAP